MKQFRTIKTFTSFILFICAASLVGCNLPARGTTTPTLNVTQAYQTVEARLTEAISRTPTVSPSQPSATDTPGAATAPPIEATETATQDTAQTPSISCDQALPGIPIDVTIPDDTIMQPGEKFTKTWRLQNAGTCTWTSDYALVWFSGEQLDAPPSVPLSGNTAPGQSVDLSVEMKAPDSEGTYQSWWKLRNPSGVLFGIGPNSDSAFWVRIVAEGTPMTTGTPTITETAGPTTTPTPGIQASGSATLQFGDLYDLDQNEINIGGEDLTYEEIDQNHRLAPIENTEMSVFGPNQPSLSDCQNMNLISDPISVDDLVGNYICYRTNMALPGWMLINSLDPETGHLNIEIFTWLIP
jgi:hypothetical protein